MSLHIPTILLITMAQNSGCIFTVSAHSLCRETRACHFSIPPDLAATTLANSCLGDFSHQLQFLLTPAYLCFITDLIKILPWLKRKKKKKRLILPRKTKEPDAQVPLWLKIVSVQWSLLLLSKIYYSLNPSCLLCSGISWRSLLSPAIFTSECSASVQGLQNSSSLKAQTSWMKVSLVGGTTDL